MMARLFSCLVLSPGELATSGPAIAAARAGGIGILDATRCAPEELPLLQARLGELVTQTPSDARIGLRIGIAQLRRFKPLISRLASRPYVLILRGKPGAALEGLSGGEGTFLTEIDSVEAAAEWQAEWPNVGGFIANGGEAAGWSSASGGFVLVQALLAGGFGPVYLRGGIGEQT